MGLADAIHAINDWGKRTRNDDAGYGEDWQNAQAAQLQRSLQADEEERQAKREERAFRHQQVLQSERDHKQAQRNALLSDYRSHAQGLLKFDPKLGYSAGEEGPDPLDHYGMLDPGERADAVRQLVGEKNLSFQERRALEQAAADRESHKNDRERAEAYAMLDAQAGRSRATHAADRDYDIAHPTPEHAPKHKDYTGVAAHQLMEAWTLKGGKGAPPGPQAIAARAMELRQSDELEKRAVFAATHKDDPLFADDADALPSPQQFQAPVTTGRKLPNGVTVKMVR